MTHKDLSDTDFERIARHVAGEMTASERAEFEAALGSDPSLAEAFEGSRAGWIAAGVADRVDVDAAWRTLRGRIGNPVAPVVNIDTPRRFWSPSVAMMSAAAAVAIAVFGATMWSRSEGSGSTLTAVAAVTLPTQQSSVELPDGSKVILGPASTLRTIGDYGSTSREVELVGEAQFTVVHDDARPFRIRTTGAFIEDLGTVFTVRAVPAEPVRVSVSEGSVRVRRAGTSDQSAVVLQPRDMAVVSDTGDPVVTRGVEVEHFQAWTQGRHDYRNTPVSEVLSDMERWFDVDFQVSDSVLLARPVNVPFERASIDEVLETLGRMLDVTFERRGRAISILAPQRTGLRSSPSTQVGSGA